MARTARRDCRKSESKKNAAVHRVDAMQRAIKKERKAGTAASSSQSAAAAPAAAEPPVSQAAASFLSQMRGEVAATLSQTRQATATASAARLSANAKDSST